MPSKPSPSARSCATLKLRQKLFASVKPIPSSGISHDEYISRSACLEEIVDAAQAQQCALLEAVGWEMLGYGDPADGVWTKYFYGDMMIAAHLDAALGWEDTLTDSQQVATYLRHKAKRSAPKK